MAGPDRVPIGLRIVIDRPVIGVAYSLQGKDGSPIDAKRSVGGEPLAFDLSLSVAPGPRFFGDQVRREGPVRRFVYVRIGGLAGDPASPWSRRMKIDIHDLPVDLIEAAAHGGAIELRVDGTAADGTPACATVRAIARRFVSH